jgi:hypothetical protein
MISKFIFIIFLGLLEKVSSNVIGIDFGSDSMKVAIVQPGSPLEIGLHIHIYIFKKSNEFVQIFV